MSDLSGTVNIGPVLAAELAAVGVTDLDSLRGLGAMNVGRRLEAAGKHDCVHAVLAIEGAIRGVRWTMIPAEERHALSRAWKEQR